MSTWLVLLRYQSVSELSVEPGTNPVAVPRVGVVPISYRSYRISECNLYTASVTIGIRMHSEIGYLSSTDNAYRCGRDLVPLVPNFWMQFAALFRTNYEYLTGTVSVSICIRVKCGIRYQSSHDNTYQCSTLLVLLLPNFMMQFITRFRNKYGYRSDTVSVPIGIKIKNETRYRPSNDNT